MLLSSTMACVSVNLTSPHCSAMSCTDSRLDRMAGLAIAGIRMCLFVVVSTCIIPLCVAGGVMLVAVLLRIIFRSGFMFGVGLLTCECCAAESRAYYLPSQVSSSDAWCAFRVSRSSCVLSMCLVVCLGD